MNPFTLFDIPPAYRVDLEALEKTYQQLSMRLHPDRHTHSLPGERKAALLKMAQINEAWNILQNPIARAEALFRLGGFALGEASEPKPEKDFLMAIMDLREDLEKAHRDRDARAIEDLKRSVQSRCMQIEEELADQLFLTSSMSCSHLESLLPKLSQLRYFSHFLKEVDMLQEEHY
ncbi:Fe-S protein assembly co-chaperone HscB [Pajaroellobacter abortibovis]|uniref:Co-chaperone protein HscB homolog n=1 Tax=Pajaroellobacter abortibovis TaxID=1882918 RepID=A0A1L6MWN0_9BACT|nr:Fe-S protein assembly co-chaperone HscB [Pajaroellobacter abortibovis]APR99845.1 Fe-S protein assembly co-chaperone HscB [Pajaroellobacter abortibovis]